MTKTIVTFELDSLAPLHFAGGTSRGFHDARLPLSQSRAALSNARGAPESFIHAPSGALGGLKFNSAQHAPQANAESPAGRERTSLEKAFGRSPPNFNMQAR